MSPRNGDGDGMKIPPFPAPPSPLASPNSSSDLSAGQPIPPSSGLKASSPAEVFPLSSNVAARDTESPELLHVRSRPREESERKDEAEAEEEEDTQQQQQQLSHQPWNWKVQQTSAGGTKRKAVEHLDISNDDEDEQHEDEGGAVRAEDDVLEPPPPAPASAGLIQQQAKPESLAA